MFGLGTTELVVIGVIVFLIFGAKRLPEIGKGVGGALREFRQIKKEVSSNGDDNDREQKDPPPLEDKLTEKVVEQVPGVKEAMDVKEKIKKVKDIIS
jgi:sec-independent protein translocase protein TatA